MKKMLVAKGLLACMCAHCDWAWAQNTSQPDNVLPTPAQTTQNSSVMPIEQKAPNIRLSQISDEQLVQQPELMAKVLDKAIEMQSWDVVKHLLSLYETMPNKNATLFHYAQARLDHGVGRYTSAINGYQEILRTNPEYNPVRLHLAQAYFENQQDAAARAEFEKLLAMPIPDEIKTLTQNYVQALERKEDWRLDGSGSYVADNNINNASTQKNITVNGVETGLQLTDASLPKSARGINYGFNIARDIKIVDQHSIVTSASVNGKFLWNQHNYDDILARINLGYQWQTARVQLAAIPFYQKRWYATKPYNKTDGVRLNGSYVLNRDWRVGGAYEFGSNTYAQRTFLDGHYHYLSLSAQHSPHRLVQIYTGVDYMSDQARDDSESSKRIGYRVGIGYDAPKNWSTQTQLGYAKKRYDANNFFGVRREDNEYTVNASLSHRGISIYGLTPRLNFERTQIKSNISLNSYRKSKIYVTVQKVF